MELKRILSDDELSLEELEFIEWLKTADEKTLRSAMTQTEKEIIRKEVDNK